MLTTDQLRQLLDRFTAQRIAVIGDFFLDKYLDTDPRLVETSIETGKSAHQVVSIRPSPGAAGTVVSNLAALQAGALHAIGAIGDDGEGYDLRRELERLGCTTSGLLKFPQLMTPTYLKPRDVTNPSLAGEHDRYDTKNRAATPDDIVAGVLDALDAVLGQVDAVIVADQVEEANCGIVTAALRDELARRARETPQLVFWADSRRHIREFRNMVIKPNQFEAVRHDSPLPTDVVELDALTAAVARLRAEVGGPVCVTRGAEGMLVCDQEITRIPGVRVEGPIDPTGAGDSVTAASVLALAAGATPPAAALVGVLTSSITVQQLATTGTAAPEELIERLKLWLEQNPAGCEQLS